jgi:hypothetical protein
MFIFIFVVDIAITFLSIGGIAFFNLISAYLFNIEEYWLKFQSRLSDAQQHMSYSIKGYIKEEHYMDIVSLCSNLLWEQWWFLSTLIDFITYNFSITWQSIYYVIKDSCRDISNRYYLSRDRKIYRLMKTIISAFFSFIGLLRGPLKLIMIFARRSLLRVIALFLIGPISSLYLINLLLAYNLLLITLLLYSLLDSTIEKRNNKSN